MNLIAANTLAQNSWQPGLFAFVNPYNPTLAGVYTFTLSAFSGSQVLASTSINVIVGQVPEPTSLLIFSSLAGVLMVPVRRRRS